MKTAIIGGGAAGFFLAINLKEMCPSMHVSVFEASQRVLAKVAVSGGGRCNCTNSFEGVTDLQQVYPRGHRLMKRLFNLFGPADAYRWFEKRGVALTTQPDHCVFPRSQNAQTIINLFLSEAERLGVEVVTGRRIGCLKDLSDFDFVAVTTGGQPRTEALEWFEQPVEPPVPSLFSFSIDDDILHALMGTVVNGASAMIPATKWRSSGPLLITHWGMSGPCILRLSSYVARHLHDAGYHSPLVVNWLGLRETEVLLLITEAVHRHPHKLITSVSPSPALTTALWQYLMRKALGQRANAPWDSLNQREMNRMVNTLTNDNYLITGRAPFKDEFVTCGGVSLKAVNSSTLESKSHPHLFFAGEVLDIDGVTGGFNFQAAWTTAFTVAKAIADKYNIL